jgi:hypothetical protein
MPDPCDYDVYQAPPPEWQRIASRYFEIVKVHGRPPVLQISQQRLPIQVLSRG